MIAVLALLSLITLQYLFSSSSPSSPGTKFEPKSGDKVVPRPRNRAGSQFRKHDNPRAPDHDRKISGAGSAAEAGLRRVTKSKAAAVNGVQVDSRGLLIYSPDESVAKNAKHPIEMLIERGKRLAKAQEAKIAEVESVDDSVDDYTGAFGMSPPKGYDAW